MATRADCVVTSLRQAVEEAVNAARQAASCGTAPLRTRELREARPGANLA
jgi:hypothetical protein